ncbi:MAG: chromate efflux transporter [Acidiferrobacterales bacterium]|nr:chromate efflux transporter [Acidiferrobacterales bacterium]
MSAVFEVFYRFLALGCVCFGGPVAHIGYFQTAFVDRLQWIDQNAYAKLVTLSQFLPGPGSSQVGFAIGLRKAGLLGGIAAFLGFTLPSFSLLFLLSVVGSRLASSILIDGAIYGLKLLAIVVVADACITMCKAFCKTRFLVVISVLSTLCLLMFQNLTVQIAVLVVAACCGVFQRNFGAKSTVELKILEHRKMGVGWISFFIFIVLFVGPPLLAGSSYWSALFSDFYYSGSLVFGGGHVVLPLLQQSVGDSLNADQFLTGYAAAQAIPGPMFSLAAYLGAELVPEQQLVGAGVATLGIFLPGFLLILAFNGAWESLMQMPKVAAASAATNAAVVGVLLAALYQLIFVSAVGSIYDVIFVIVGFVVIRYLSIPIVLLVLLYVVFGIFLQYL